MKRQNDLIKTQLSKQKFETHKTVGAQSSPGSGEPFIGWARILGSLPQAWGVEGQSRQKAGDNSGAHFSLKEC